MPTPRRGRWSSGLGRPEAAVVYVRRPLFCWLSSQAAKVGAFSPDLLGLARALLAATGAGGGSAAWRAIRRSFSLAMLSSTAFAEASRSVLPVLASCAALVILLIRASARSRSSLLIWTKSPAWAWLWL